MSTFTTPPSIWVGQRLHVVSLAFLLLVSYWAWAFLGKPFPVAFWSATSFPIVHQVFVWLAWRLELQYSLVSKTIGLRSYIVLFFFLFGGRFISLLFLSWLDRGSLPLHTIPLTIITIALTLPGLYAIYSVRRYFGMVRAAGADHFDPKYRTIPFVKEGIFKFSINAMYTYAFLLFWAIATGFNSSAALVVAAFSHAYIWVHFYATEKPDMDFLYSSAE